MDGTGALPGALLRRFRTRRSLTQEELAARAGLSVRALRDIEQHRVVRPQPRSLERLADALALAPTDRAELLASLPSRAPVAPAGPLQVGVLGPLSVRRAGTDLEIGSGMQRALLGLLALQTGQTVGREEIVDVLWDDRPPRTCLSLIHGYVAQLRGLLDPRPAGAARRAGSVISSVRGGYRLEPARATLDALRFGELTAGPDGSYGALREALQCWRGPVLADAPGPLRSHPAALALNSRRVAVALAFADAAFAAGQHREAADLLESLAHHEPLHEGLHARLMLAIAGAGEQSAALQLFARVRGRLADELGVEPGAELRAAHLQVLRQQPEPVTTAVANVTGPAQLPADVGSFAGRQQELRQLDQLLTAARGTTAVAVAAITGTAGVGKTALAVHWAHQVRERFGDGQLYVNLLGFAPGRPVRSIEALARFLRALGVPGEQIPVDEAEAAALYRTLLADRRMLIVLDNAREVEQVRPLLPGSPGCLVLITSRDGLAGLIAREGATRIGLDALTADEARALLTRILGDSRVADEPAALADLTAACAYLPLALRIAAANLIGDPQQPIAEYVAGLAADALSGLAVEGDTESAVRAAFRRSYDVLSAGDRRLFRLLGVQPGHDCTADAAAALAGISPLEAGRGLARLADAHLINRTAPGRYSFHDLLRRYAIDRADAEDPAPERHAAAERLYGWYVGAVDGAAALLYPHLLREPVLPGAGAPPEFTSHADALAWLDAERSNLVAAIVHPAEGAPPAASWTIAGSMRSYLHARTDSVEWLPLAEASLAAARQAGDPRGQAVAHLGLACCCDRQADHERAIRHYTAAVALAREAGWREGQGPPLGNLGLVYWKLGQLELAVSQHRQALAVNRETGRLGAQAINLVNIGIVCVELGRLAEAAEHHHQALTIHRRSGSRYGEAMALGNLADDYHALGRLTEAHRYATQALALDQETGNRSAHAETLRILAEIHRDTGRYALSQSHATEAVELARTIGDRRLEASALVTLGRAWLSLGNAGEAAAQHQLARDVAAASRTRLHEATAALGLAAARAELGDTATALVPAQHALSTARAAGYRMVEGQAEAALAAVRLRAGQPEEAATHARRSAEIQRETGHRLGLARALRLLGDARRDTEGVAAAAAHWQDALALFDEVGAAEAAGVRELLAPAR